MLPHILFLPRISEQECRVIEDHELSSGVGSHGKKSPHTVLHIYISTDTEEDLEQIRARLHTSLKKHDSSYADLEDMLKWDPLRLTLLPLGVFNRWQQERVAAGADPAFVKEQRMQPPAEAIQRILEFSKG